MQREIREWSPPQIHQSIISVSPITRGGGRLPPEDTDGIYAHDNARRESTDTQRTHDTDADPYADRHDRIDNDRFDPFDPFDPFRPSVVLSPAAVRPRLGLAVTAGHTGVQDIRGGGRPRAYSGPNDTHLGAPQADAHAYNYNDYGLGLDGRTDGMDAAAPGVDAAPLGPAPPPPTLYAHANESLARARDLVESTFVTSYSGRPESVQRYDAALDSRVVPPKELRYLTTTMHGDEARRKGSRRIFGRVW